MDKKKASQFLSEIRELEEKYGLQLSAAYEEEIDYDYEESPYVSGINAHLMITDKDGFEVSVYDLDTGYSLCYYCGRSIDVEKSFCHNGCEEKFYKQQKRR